jgi:hypothetical protein
MDRDDNQRESPPAVEEPPYQAVTPNLDKFSRASLKRGSVSRRRIVRAAVALLGLVLAAVAVVAWSIYLT